MRTKLVVLVSLFFLVCVVPNAMADQVTVHNATEFPAIVELGTWIFPNERVTIPPISTHIFKTFACTTSLWAYINGHDLSTCLEASDGKEAGEKPRHCPIACRDSSWIIASNPDGNPRWYFLQIFPVVYHDNDIK